MIKTITNGYLQLSVKEAGAEICSIKSIKSGKEFIWDANPDFWANHAPILFPIVGALKEGKYKYKGKEYSLPQHGFFRHNEKVKIINNEQNKLSYFLKNDEESLKVFPFEFEFFTIYSLVDNRVCIKHQVFNPGNEVLLFSIGTHPAFKCPINIDETYDDYYLEFEKEENSFRHCIDKGLIGKELKKVFDTKDIGQTNDSDNRQSIINLHTELFREDAFVFKDLKSKHITLKSKKSKQSVKISFDGFPYMGIWAKPNPPFVCIEPWLGIADGVDTDQNFENKEGIIKLDPKEWFNAAYYIEINE